MEIIAGLFVFLFLYTALSKFFNHEYFVMSMRQSPLIGRFSTLLSWVIPVLEIVIVITLFIPRFRQGGLKAAAIMMASFTLYIGYMLIFVPDLPCTCGGVLQQMTWPQHMTFNIFFLLLALAGTMLNKKTKILSR